MDPMFAQGLELMLVGMGVVFAFLLLLVWLVGLMSSVVARYAAPETVATDAVPTRPAATPSVAAPDARTLAVIREAIRQHRAGR